MRRPQEGWILGHVVWDLWSENTMKYIAKPDTWFDAGTVVILLADGQQCGGIFLGLRNGKLDEELCAWEEFDIQDT